MLVLPIAAKSISMHLHNIVKGAFVFLIREDEILFSKRKETSHYNGYYGVISGNVEENETFESAIIREAEEEIGIKLKSADLKVVHVMHRIDQEDESFYVFYVVNAWQGEIVNKEPERCAELLWQPLDNPPEMVVPYVKEVINHYMNETFFSEATWR